jgi:translation initiation factor IF-2
VEDWGGKYQCQEISAKKNLNIDELLEKILLEAELLDLKANPNKNAVGTVIESSLDKGKGYVTNMLVEAGTLRVGDVVLVGRNHGKVRAMHDEHGKSMNEVGPAMPVSILGINGAPSAGDKFHIMDDEREAKSIATKREQLYREQGLRTNKHITLDEIGRRLAVGDFKELNLIVKGDVDGSIEALSDSLLRLSTEEIQVNIVHKGVGAISEADVNLASASDAIILGFQVRPSVSSRKLAEAEQIDIRLYSVIYKAIEEIKAAMEGMLSPDVVEEIIGTAEIRETFNISKVGTIAGCYVTSGMIKRSSKIRIIRDGIVIHTGELGSLKRFKDDVKEVKNNYECGLNIERYNDIKEGDVVEAYEEKEVARKL